MFYERRFQNYIPMTPPPPKKKTLWPHPTPKDDDMNKLEFTPPNEAFT